MLDTFIAILGIYLFILVGFSSKAVFKQKIDPQTLNLLSVYFLQVFLTIWGLTKRDIDFELIVSPFLYLGIILSVLLFSSVLAKFVFKDKSERSIASIAALIGNTGNLGIPLGIAVFGEQSIPYTTLINLMNVFFVYTFGVYFYSRGRFSIKASLLNILKLPILYAATIAIILNISHIHIPQVLEKTLMMGAYTSMSIQLILFGMYMYEVKLKQASKKLMFYVMGKKFIFIPVLAYIVLINIDIPSIAKSILFFELLMPLAVANVNIASLYKNDVSVITTLVLLSSFVFLGVLLFSLDILKSF